MQQFQGHRTLAGQARRLADLLTPKAVGEAWRTRPELREWTPVAAIALAAFLLRMFVIGETSFWMDEGWSLWFSSLSIGELFGDVAKLETNPVLYYAMLKGWMGLFGDSEAAVRSLSALLNAATTPFIYLIAREAARVERGRVIGLLAAGLFALTFLQLRYAQEARTYALLVLGMAVMLAGMVSVVKWAERMTAADPLPLPAIFALGGGMALTIWGHNTAVVGVAVTVAALGAWWLIAMRASIRVLQALALAGLIALGLAAPALWWLLAYTIPNTTDFWIEKPTPFELAQLLTHVFGADLGLLPLRFEAVLRAGLFLSWPAVALWVGLRSQDQARRWILILLAACSFGVAAGFIAITYASRPVLIERVLLPAQLGWIVLCALALDAIRPNLRRWAMLAMLAVFALGAIGYFAARHRIFYEEDWRKVVGEIHAKATGPARVVTREVQGVVVSYYLKRLGEERLTVVNLPYDPKVFDMSHFRSGVDKAPWFGGTDEEVRAAYPMATRSGEPTWVIVRDRERDADFVEFLRGEGVDVDRPDVSSGLIAVYYLPGGPAKAAGSDGAAAHPAQEDRH